MRRTIERTRAVEDHPKAICPTHDPHGDPIPSADLVQR
jgi:hypothetical protein